MSENISRLILLTLITSLFLCNVAVYAPVSDPDITVPRMVNPVSLDGDVEAGEWSEAAKVSTLFHFWEYFPVAEYLGNRSATLYFKHDCVNLYIAAVIEDPVENLTVWSDPLGAPEVIGDSLWVYYDVSGDKMTGSGDDLKMISHPNITRDSYFASGWPPGDESLGGSNNLEGYSTWSSGFIMYEFVHPLDSGDWNGYDLSVEPGGTTLADIVVLDPELGGSESNRYDLIITECPAVGGVLTSTTSSVFAFFYLVILLLSLFLHSGKRIRLVE